MTFKFRGYVAAALLTLSAVGFAQGTTNPAPTVRLQEFGHFELKDMSRPEIKDGAAQKAADTLQEHLRESINGLIATWTQGTEPHGDRSLVIQPALVEMHFVGGKARFWAGAFAGNSFVVMRVKLTDAATGEVIAEPEFYQRANAMGGAWSIGKTDRSMLQREADLVAKYLSANYAQAVGGPTGRD